MQLNIDLSDLFCDGEEPCDLQDAVKREVVRNITALMEKNLHREVDNAISRVMDAEIAVAVQAQLPKIIDDIINIEYVPIDTYGSRKEPTTFRNELLKKFQSEMQCIVKEQLTQFKAGFDKQVNAEFIAEVHKYAISALAKKLGVNIN